MELFVSAHLQLHPMSGWIGCVDCCHRFFSKRALSFPGSCKLLVVGSFFALCCKLYKQIMWMIYIYICMYAWIHVWIGARSTAHQDTDLPLFPMFEARGERERRPEKPREEASWMRGWSWELPIIQGTIGRKPLTVYIPMVFIVFSRDSWGLQPINTHYIGLI